MNKITSAIELKEAILVLEIKRKNEQVLLKEQFKSTFESLRPVDLIKNSLHEIVTAPALKADLLNAILSLGVGYLSKKVIVGETQNPLKQILAALLQIGVTNLVSKNTAEIKSKIMELINSFLNKKEVED